MASLVTTTVTGTLTGTNHISTGGTYSLRSYGVGVFGGTNTEQVELFHNGSTGARLDVTKYGTGSYRDFRIFVSGAEAFKIDTSKNATFAGAVGVTGNFGIGMLPNSGNSPLVINNSASDYLVGLYRGTVSEWWFKVYATGNFAIHENGVGDKFTIAAGGAATFAGALTVSGTALFSDGLVGSPSISFAGDTDTGIWRPGSNQLWFVTTGVNRLKLDGSGNAEFTGALTGTTATFSGNVGGVGLTLSDGWLELYNANVLQLYSTPTTAGANYETFALDKPDAGNARLRVYKSGTGTYRGMEFQTGGSARLTISAAGAATFSGALTVGTTTSIGQQVFVQGSANSGEGATVTFKRTTTTAGHIGTEGGILGTVVHSNNICIFGVGNNVSIYGGNQATNFSTFNSSGLAVTGTGTFTGALTIGAYTLPNTDGTTGYHLQTNGSGTVTWQPGGGGTVTGSGTDNYIPRWNGTTALHNSIIYDSGASVGISSVAFSSPAGTLHTQAVGSNITYLDAYSATPGTGSMMIFRKSASATVGKTQTGNGDSLGTFTFYGVNSNPSPDWGLGAAINISQEGTSGASYVPAHMAFSTCTASAYGERMRIASDGNVGIGTNDPSTKLQVNDTNDSRLLIYETGATPYTATLELASQVVGTYGALIQYTSAAERLTIQAYGRTASNNSNQGGIGFKTKLNNTTPTEVVSIHGFSGNVGIGITVPTAKLHVQGTIRMGTGSYMLGEATSGIRLNNSADTLNLIVARNDGDVHMPGRLAIGGTTHVAGKWLTVIGPSSFSDALSGTSASFSTTLNVSGLMTAGLGHFQNSSHTIVTIKAHTSGNKYSMLQMTSNGTQDNYIRADVGDLIIDGSHTSVNITKALVVSGTSTFSDDLYITTDQNIHWSGNYSFITGNGANSSGYLKFYTSDTLRLTIAGDGAATFTGALTGTTATFSGIIQGGPTSTSGGAWMRQNYSGTSHHLGVIGNTYSSGNMTLGFGAVGKAGGSGYTSTMSNFSTYRSILELSGNTLYWKTTAAASTTAVGSDLTMVNRMYISNTSMNLFVPLAVAGNLSAIDGTFGGPLTTVGLLNVTQTADNDGIRFRGYDDVNSYYGKIGLSDVGYLQIFAEGNRSIDLKSGRQIRFYTSGDNSTYNNSVNFNSDGSSTFSAAVSDDVIKLYIDNTGGLPTAGTQQGGAIVFRSFLGDSNMRHAAEIRGVYLGVATDSNKNRGGLVFRTMEPNGLADRMLINEDGNVGIGTTNPGAYKLYVNGTTNLNGALTGTSATFSGMIHAAKSVSAGETVGLFIENTAASAVGNKAVLAFGTDAGATSTNNPRIEVENVNASNGASKMVFKTHASGGNITEAFRLNSDASATFSGKLTGTLATFSGNVGIGIADPGTYELNVNGEIYSSGTVTIANNKYYAGLNTSGAMYALLKLNSSNQMEIGATNMAAAGYPARVLAKYITFEPAGTLGAPVETMRVTNGSFNGVGSVGIGTTAPDRKFHVVGTDEVARFTGTDANPPTIEFENSTGVQAKIGLKSGHDFIIDTAGEDIFMGAAANEFTIKADGKVGIGDTTPTDGKLVISSSSTDLNALYVTQGSASGSAVDFKGAYISCTGSMENYRDKFGIDVYCLTNNWSHDEIFGVNVLAEKSSSGNNNVYGVKSIARCSSTYGQGGTKNFYGLYGKVEETGSETITTAYSVYAASPTGSVTNAWGFYQGGDAKNQFGGSVGIGADPGSFMLNVNGTSQLNGLVTVNQVGIKIFNGWGGVSTTLGGGSLFMGFNVKGASDGNKIEASNTHSGGAGWAYMRCTGYTNGISFHTKAGNTTAGEDAVTNERMRIDGNGNVGIGIAAPGYKTQIVSPSLTWGTSITDASAALSVVKGYQDGANDSDVNVARFASVRASYGATADWAGHISLFTNAGVTGGQEGTERARITWDGNSKLYFGRSTSKVLTVQTSGGDYVGIGTNAPVSKLHVVGSGTWNHTPGQNTTSDLVITSSEMSDNNAHSILQLVSVRQSLSTGSGATGYLGFTTMDDSNAQGVRDAGRIAIVNEFGSSRNSATALSFWTNAGGTDTTAPTEKMRIQSDGNVGIGTTSPGYLLDVRGNTWVQGSLETSGQLKAGTSLAIGSSGSGGYTFPATDGTNGYVLKTNGSGTVAWAADSGGGGTVTSVATSGAITGGTITTTGTITHSTSPGYKHVPTGGSSKQYLKYSSSGTAVWSTLAWEDLPDISTLTALP